MANVDGQDNVKSVRLCFKVNQELYDCLIKSWRGAGRGSVKIAGININSN